MDGVPEAVLAPSLSGPQNDMLMRVAGHKYGWSYISRRDLATGDALVRRGLVNYGESHGRDHWKTPALVLTDQGYSFIREIWPNCPAALESYDGPALISEWGAAIDATKGGEG